MNSYNNLSLFGDTRITLILLINYYFQAVLLRSDLRGKLNSRSSVVFPGSIVNLEEYTKEKLWAMLVEQVHASVMYPTHKAYTRESILPKKPDVTPLELAERLNLRLGEAIVILGELAEETRIIAAQTT